MNGLPHIFDVCSSSYKENGGVVQLVFFLLVSLKIKHRLSSPGIFINASENALRKQMNTILGKGVH